MIILRFIPLILIVTYIFYTIKKYKKYRKNLSKFKSSLHFWVTALIPFTEIFITIDDIDEKLQKRK